MDLIADLRTDAAALLRDGRAKLVIGYRAGGAGDAARRAPLSAIRPVWTSSFTMRPAGRTWRRTSGNPRSVRAPPWRWSPRHR